MELVQRDMRVKNGEVLTIAPICDIQYTGEGGSLSVGALERYLEEARTRNAYYVGLGDYIDFLSPSNRARLGHAALYDTAMEVIKHKATELTRAVYHNYLARTGGRWLGLVHGHHWAETSLGKSSDEVLADLLGAPYLGTSAMIVLDIYSDDDSERHGQLTLWLHHGRGNGRASAPINTLERVSSKWDADVYMIGHMTKLASAAINRVYPVKRATGDWAFKHRKQVLVGCGGWSKAYMQGNRKDGRIAGCYVEEAMMDPAALGGVFIKLKCQWDQRAWTPTLTVEL